MRPSRKSQKSPTLKSVTTGFAENFLFFILAKKFLKFLKGFLSKVRVDDGDDECKFEEDENGVDFDHLYTVALEMIENRKAKNSKNKKLSSKSSSFTPKDKIVKENKTDQHDFSQNLIATIAQYEGLVASLPHEDPMRKAY